MFDKNKFIKNKIKNYYSEKRKTEKQIKIYNLLVKNDVVHQIINNLRIRMLTLLKEHNLEREIPYSEILGCSVNEFKKYIEERFTKEMTYDNYGEWEIDHIYPISKINFEDYDDMDKCFHYTNLQPLWLSENRKKYNKLIN